MWIERDITKTILENKDPIQVIRGPRQCGKSSLILKIDPEFQELSLDDPSLRELAQNDPELFLKQFPSKKLFIDEAQYAPALFPSLKRRADLYKREKKKQQTILRLTGSNQILMDKSVKESLAGRASFFDMNTLSISEILSAKKESIQNILFMGGWPELYNGERAYSKKYLDDYINSYVEKDIILSAGIQKSSQFMKFIKLLAGRVGCVVEYSSLSSDVGVDSKTCKEWISILEKMNIVRTVLPFSTSLSTRLIKSPKIYFLDTGLACRLQGWTSPEPILTSPQQGLLFENLVFSEIYKLNMNFQLGWEIFHWRSRDKEEIDFLIQKDPKSFLFIECKVSRTTVRDHTILPEVRKVFQKKIPELILCHQEGNHILKNTVPIALLKKRLLEK
ncbi:MAG: ATP-binding protein [Leptospiraceae bacterium]|nr:ATP-binding protein [Leptospiraceae bacterium]MCP5511014.1 ATP-binding protein [Leptospiraceae bacterium]